MILQRKTSKENIKDLELIVSHKNRKSINNLNKSNQELEDLELIKNEQDIQSLKETFMQGSTERLLKNNELV